MNEPMISQKRRCDPLVSIVSLAAVLAGAIQLGLTWHYMLDDALIHMRYAELLLQVGFPTSDGIDRSYGVSSPAFLLLNAAGYWLSGSLYTAKLLSVAGFAAIVACLVFAACRASRSAVRSVYLLNLLLVVSPFGLRWLTAGMETSLAVLCALLLAARLARPNTPTPGADLATGGIACICVLFRVECLVLVGAVSCIELLRARHRSAAAAAAGAAVAIALVYLMFGAVLSDAAIAKVRFEFHFGDLEYLRVYGDMLARSVVGAGLFGVGLLLVWIVLFLMGVGHLRAGGRWDRDNIGLLLGSLSLVAIVLASLVRGQTVEGIRPLLPFFAFSLACGTMLFSRVRDTKPLPTAMPVRATASWRVAVPVCAAFALVLGADWSSFRRIAGAYSDTLLEMRGAGLAQLRSLTGLASDVGFISYFSKARICDIEGLINGTGFARLSLDDRLNVCAPRAEFAFVDQQRFEMLSDKRDLTGWRVCRRVAFAHRSDSEILYLLLAPGLSTGTFCAHPAGRLEGSGPIELSKFF